MAPSNERVTLIRALICLFAFQLGVAGYQTLTCDKTKSGGIEMCTKSNENLVETSRSVANVFLALLVPAAAASVIRGNRSSAKASKPDNTTDGKG